MIIWLASYPKSGNTWLRSFLYTLLYSKNQNPDLNKMDNLGQYPLKKHFKAYTNNFNDIHNISKYWEESQKNINLDHKVKFLKTHHVLCTVNGNKFTNLNNTLGVIHIVRDPRNLITSIKNHYSMENYNEALKFIFDYNHCIDVENISHDNLEKKEILNTWVSSWETHYNSWKSFPKNYLLIKYEDLIDDPEKWFFYICDYLTRILNIKFDKKIVKKIIYKNEFQNLQNQEKSDGFKESSVNFANNKKNIFFKLGPKNKWQELLNKEIKEQIENKFKKEMSALDYL